MVAHIIRFLLQNLPALLFVIALVIAGARRRHGPLAERFLSWILLLPIGITGLWAGAFHVFFPATAAKLIGWDMSPFQLEVGMADLAIGATACIAFWRDLSFKAAAVSVASIFLLGDAVGHVKQMLLAGNFAQATKVAVSGPTLLVDQCGGVTQNAAIRPGWNHAIVTAAAAR